MCMYNQAPNICMNNTCYVWCVCVIQQENWWKSTSENNEDEIFFSRMQKMEAGMVFFPALPWDMKWNRYDYDM